MYVCTCGARFATAAELSAHMATHGLLPFMAWWL